MPLQGMVPTGSSPSGGMVGWEQVTERSSQAVARWRSEPNILTLMVATQAFFSEGVSLYDWKLWHFTCWNRDKMAASLQTTFVYFFHMKTSVSWFELSLQFVHVSICSCNAFALSRRQRIIWNNDVYVIQVHRPIYESPGLNELTDWHLVSLNLFICSMCDLVPVWRQVVARATANFSVRPKNGQI